MFKQNDNCQFIIFHGIPIYLNFVVTGEPQIQCLNKEKIYIGLFVEFGETPQKYP